MAKHISVKLLNSLTLAYMGDAIFDQHVREYIVLKLRSEPHRLRQVSKSYVPTKNQAKALGCLLGINWFTEEELNVLKRGRNARNYAKTKNTDIQTCRKSSALEAVIGSLHLDHQSERLKNLLETIVKVVGER